MTAAELTLNDPQLRAFLSAGEGACDPCIDWLQDRDASPHDVAVLYAGAAPGHEGGLPQSWVARWLDVTGRPEVAAAVRACVLEQYEVGGGPPLDEPDPQERFRLELVDCIIFRAERAYSPRSLPTEDIINAVGAALGAPDLTYQPCELALRFAREELARARRDLKRRVLSLPFWAGLRWQRCHAVTSRELELYGRAVLVGEVFGPGRLRPDLPWRRVRRGEALVEFWQDVRAGELVPLDAWREFADMPARAAEAAIMRNEETDFATEARRQREELLRRVGVPASLL